MVLRSSPWESRTSLTNEGHLRAEGPVTRVVAGPSFVWAPGARAPAFRRRRVPGGPLRPTRAGATPFRGPRRPRPRQRRPALGRDGGAPFA